ncbi:MAG: hypothetical protein NTV49_09775 [Kiritimatiellaeota bacterium]|nr:hypothetical protein [Kiritimatiellota bacterium]
MTMMRQIMLHGLLLALGAAPGAIAAPAALRAGRMFSDHMILQRDMAVPVWGTATPGETIVVAFRDQKKQTTADAQGNWQVKLDPLKAGEPGELTVRGGQAGEAVTFADVLAGEVWIGTGQSNMAGHTGGYRKGDEALNAWAEDASNRKIRLYDTQKGVWKTASPKTIDPFSALGFAFCYSLSKGLNVPIGMMVVAYGGRPSGDWITPEMAAGSGDPILRKLGVANRTAAAGQTADKPAGGKPRFLTREQMGLTYKNGIKRFWPYGIRGVLWDQGEAGTALEGVDQCTAMSALVAGWRKDWGQGDFPFLHLQKPSGGGCAWDPADPVNRGAAAFTPQPAEPQQMSHDKMDYTLNHIRMGTIKNAPLVTTMDLATGVHPATKSAYGSRACRVALGAVYGRDVAICGPVYRSHVVAGGSLRITFDHVGKGLAIRLGAKLQGFEIAGADGKWDWAEANIDGNTVVLRSGAVPAPTQVRYAFNPRPSYANLFNKDGLPALMFTTETLQESAIPSRGRW